MRRLYELDGRKSFPIDHGPTSPSTFLQVCFGTVLLLHACTLQGMSIMLSQHCMLL